MKKLLSVGAFAMLLAAAAGSQIGFGQQKVEMMPGGFGIPVAPRGLWGKKLPEKPKRRERSTTSEKQSNERFRERVGS
jgi:hypothetical protein